MPKRKGKLRKDEFPQTNILTGETRIKRRKKMNIFKI